MGLEKWANIPPKVEVLLTHTPPIGHGDLCSTGVRAGCVELLSEVQQRIKPRYHVFGHVHEGAPAAKWLSLCLALEWPAFESSSELAFLLRQEKFSRTAYPCQKRPRLI